MSRQDVEEVILARLPYTFGPHLHLSNLSGNLSWEEEYQRVAQAYIDALERFHRTTLERAFEQVRHSHGNKLSWPRPGVLEQAARILQPQAARSALPGPTREQAWQIAEDYVDRYLEDHKQQVRSAKKAGWLGRLKTYVREAARVQAQLILKTDGVSWATAVLAEPEQQGSANAALQALREQMAEPVARGQIDVQVPRKRLQQWRQEVKEHGPPELDSDLQERWQRLANSLREREKRQRRGR